jgi:hypothetical protein
MQSEASVDKCDLNVREGGVVVSALIRVDEVVLLLRRRRPVVSCRAFDCWLWRGWSWRKW